MGGSFFFLFSIFFLAIQTSNCATLVVDGVSHLSNHTAHIGDTIIFKHKNEYNLYIFRNKEAFNACNFTQATPLSDPNSTTYTWHASRPGFFYFSFFNNTNKPCQDGQKLAVEIINPHASPENHATPPKNHATSPESPPPAFPWPFQPREKSGSGPPSLGAAGGVSPAPAMPLEKGGSIPFISSNPAVPLPTGEVDSDTMRPWPLSVNHAPNQGVKVVGLIEALISLYCVIMLML